MVRGGGRCRGVSVTKREGGGKRMEAGVEWRGKGGGREGGGRGEGGSEWGGSG